MTPVYHVRQDGIFMGKSIESIVSPRFKFSKDRFGNRDNVRIQIQFRRIRQY